MKNRKNNKGEPTRMWRYVRQTVWLFSVLLNCMFIFMVIPWGSDISKYWTAGSRSGWRNSTVLHIFSKWYCRSDGLWKGGKRKKIDCTWKNNKHESTLHRVIIYKTCMSLKMLRSYNNEFVLFKNVKLDDYSTKRIGEVVENFIM